MRWRRLPGDVWIRSNNGTTLMVFRTVAWINYGQPRGKQAGNTWQWQCRGNRIGQGIEHTRRAAQEAVESQAGRK